MVCLQSPSFLLFSLFFSKVYNLVQVIMILTVTFFSGKDRTGELIKEDIRHQ